jgi:hypothetical protein
LFVAKANADSPFEGVTCVPHGALVASLPLAAGAFLLSGMLVIDCSDGDKQTCTIEVKSDDQSIYSFYQQMGSVGSDTDHCLLPISIPLTVRAPTTVTVIGHGFNIIVGAILSALKIGTLHGDSMSA